MSTWTNSPACGVIAACLLAASVSAALAQAAGPPRRIAVSDRQVVIAGPEGYCIDLSAAIDGAQGAFVLLGNCAAIGGSALAAQPGAPAVLTAAVAPGGAISVAEQLAELAGFFRSPRGRAALSRSGNPDSVLVFTAWASKGVFYLHARDKSAPDRSGVQPEFWRAVLDIKGRFVTLSVTGLRTSPLMPPAGRATIEAFVRQVQTENRK